MANLFLTGNHLAFVLGVLLEPGPATKPMVRTKSGRLAGHLGQGKYAGFRA